MKFPGALGLLAGVGSVLFLGQAASTGIEDHVARRPLGERAGAATGACSSNDRTYSTEATPAGQYMDWSSMNSNGIRGATQYITIVNLTPHRIVLQSTHEYQMDVFDWGDISQGHARQNAATYTDYIFADDGDDGGEAYYSIDGTGKTFVVRVTTQIGDANPKRVIFDLGGMGLGQREYAFPATGAAVTLIITGSNDYGFISNIRFGAGNWMKGIYDVIKDRQIQHVVMPGSHDAGMSQISGQILSIGSSSNTQTQGLSIHDQLLAGSRYFDWRVGSIHNGDSYSFWTMHVNDELADVVVGNSGESVDAVVSEINEFTAANPGEIIFFRLRYLVGIRNVPIGGPIYWDTDMVNAFFNKLKGVNNRCGNLDTSNTFNEKPASYFMDQNDGKGCVVFLLAGDLQSGVPQDSIADGIYRADRLTVDDHWSNKPDTQSMAEDQAAHWKGVSRPGGSDTFLIGQWLVSADAVQSTFDTLQSIALQPTNPALYWMGANNMSPETWPNVLLTDYVGMVVSNQTSWDLLSADAYTLAIGLNLYMISENCAVSSGRSPLLPPLSQGVLRTNSLSITRPWKGIVYANGTVDDNPPAHFRLGQPSILRNGTVFSNGTVLTEDVKNPDFLF